MSSASSTEQPTDSAGTSSGATSTISPSKQALSTAREQPQSSDTSNISNIHSHAPAKDEPKTKYLNNEHLQELYKQQLDEVASALPYGFFHFDPDGFDLMVGDTQAWYSPFWGFED